MKLDLDDTNVIEFEMSVEDARKMVDGDPIDDLITAFDEAQGLVYTRENHVAYLVIKIT
jgi:hypothetical protein